MSNGAAPQPISTPAHPPAGDPFSRVCERLRPFGTTVFTEMTQLANKHGAVNLAQGFPDFDGPEFIKHAAARAIADGHNQYARSFGLPALNRALADAWLALTSQLIDPDTQVTITSGCTEAIAAALLGLMSPGDEVILFEPYYDSYRASVVLSGATPKFVALRPPTAGDGPFVFDPGELRKAFTARTRTILVNTPHNPTGKVFTREELTLIAELCQQHDVIAITDEVYEHLTFDAALPHVRLATLPGMAARTLTLSSLGKSFSLTGWKIGWAIGPADLSRAVRAAHQFLTFSTSTPLQHAAATAAGLGPEARAAIQQLVTDLRANRALVLSALSNAGFRVFSPAGAYFVMVDWRDVRVPSLGRLGDALADDVAFCKHLTEFARVAAIPPSAFYDDKSLGKGLARFAFCKKSTTLQAGIDRLNAWCGVSQLA